MQLFASQEQLSSAEWTRGQEQEQRVTQELLPALRVIRAQRLQVLVLFRGGRLTSEAWPALRER